MAPTSERTSIAKPLPSLKGFPPEEEFVTFVGRRSWSTYASPLIPGFLRLHLALSPRDAETNIARLLAHPKVRVLEEGDSFWSHYAAISESMPLRGNLVPDAHIAAILNRNGITALYSRDRDFRRFDFLKVTDPFL